MALGLQRAGGNRAVAALLQRVEVPGTQLDTSRRGDWEAIENHLLARGMTVAQLTELVAHLEEVREQSSEFERIVLRFARYRRAEMSDIGTVYHHADTSGGVWTMATVLVNGEQKLVTAPARAGGERVRHGQSNAITESETHSETATLNALSEFVGTAKLPLWRDVNVIFSGSMGPCDGCRQRLQGFIDMVDRMAWNVGAKFRLVLDVNYSTKTNKPDIRHTYGYGDDTELADLPGTDEQYVYWTRRFVCDCGDPRP